MALLLLVLLAAAGGGAWYAGLLDRFLKEQLPVVTPYTLTAEPGGTLAAARLAAHAPDVAGAEALRTAFQALAGEAAAQESVTLAQGMPQPGWLAGRWRCSLRPKGWRIGRFRSRTCSAGLWHRPDPGRG